MSQDGKNNWVVYIKLFIMMGVGFVVLILTPFFDHIALWIIIIITTAGQGLYISLISIFNSQMLNYIRANWNKEPSNNSQKRNPKEHISLSQGHVESMTESHTNSSTIEQLSPISTKSFDNYSKQDQRIYRSSLKVPIDQLSPTLTQSNDEAPKQRERIHRTSVKLYLE